MLHKGTRKANFKRLATKRMQATLRMYRLLGNLAEQINYCYTDEQIDQMETVLKNELENTITKLRSRENRKEYIFKLDTESKNE
jgi:hypothetical protein